MAAHEKKMNLTEHDGVLGVIISRDEFREYVELQKKRDRSELSLRAQMQAQNQTALKLATLIDETFEKAGFEDASAIFGENRTKDIYDLAIQILEEDKA